MRRVPLIALLVALLGAQGQATGPADAVMPLLRMVEGAPTRAQLDGAAVTDDASALLRSIAGDAGASSHARVHAYAALASYPGGATQLFLVSAVQQFADDETGPGVVYLRAAARSLGVVGGAASVGQLALLLDHAVPDVRADAASALASTLSDEALPVLRSHLLREKNEMVLLAISEAIRALTRQ
jgi:hypothetical protein